MKPISPSSEILAELGTLSPLDVEARANSEILRCRRGVFGDIRPEQFTFDGTWSPCYNRDHSYLVLLFTATCTGLEWPRVNDAVKELQNIQGSPVLGAAGEVKAALLAWHLNTQRDSGANAQVQDQLRTALQQSANRRDPRIDHWAASEVMGWVKWGGENFYRSGKDGSMVNAGTWSPSTNRNDSHIVIQAVLMKANLAERQSRVFKVWAKIVRGFNKSWILSAHDECQFALNVWNAIKEERS